YCVLDSPDQQSWQIDCGQVSWTKPDLAFEVPAVGGAWRGTLSADGAALSGTWTQGRRQLPLKLLRQVRALEPPPDPKMTTAPALPPAQAAALPALVRKDFAAALRDGPLGPATSAGVEITLLDLITHRSGLPRLPGNFNPADPNDPYADYHAAELYGFLRQRGVAKPADAGFLYSNLGVGLL